MLAGIIQHLSAQIASQDNDRVLEIDCMPKTVGETPFVQHLQQQVENVGMCLFHLIKQDHLIGLTTNSLGQNTTLFITNVAGRRTNQARDAVLFHKFTHVQP